jgi:hypothetical protein
VGAPRPPATPPREAAIDVFTIVGGCSRTSIIASQGVRSLFRGGLGATIGTLQTRYLRVQDSRQDKEHGVHPRAATCPTAPDPTSMLRWAPVPPRAPRLWTSLPRKGGLRHCHVPHGSELYLLEGRAPMPPRIPQLSAGRR